MAIGYAITYQYFTSVNYLCLPLHLNTIDARAVFIDTTVWFTYITKYLLIYIRTSRSNRFRHGKCLTVAALGFLKFHIHTYYKYNL